MAKRYLLLSMVMVFLLVGCGATASHELLDNTDISTLPNDQAILDDVISTDPPVEITEGTEQENPTVDITPPPATEIYPDAETTETQAYAPSDSPSEESTESRQEDPTLEHVHNYIRNTTIMPTCTTAGYTVYACSCGDSYPGDEVAATGHGWSDWVVIQEATTDTAGIQTRTCTGCSETEIEAVPMREAEAIDTSELSSYGNSYARSLGFIIDYSVRDGYNPPDTIAFTSMSAAKSNIAANVRILYNTLIARGLPTEACRTCVIVVDNGDGTYTTTVYYG